MLTLHLSVKTLAAFAATGGLTFGGAAYAGALPDAAQDFAHATIGAPAAPRPTKGPDPAGPAAHGVESQPRARESIGKVPGIQEPCRGGRQRDTCRRLLRHCPAPEQGILGRRTRQVQRGPRQVRRSPRQVRSRPRQVGGRTRDARHEEAREVGQAVSSTH